MNIKKICTITLTAALLSACNNTKAPKTKPRTSDEDMMEMFDSIFDVGDNFTMNNYMDMSYQEDDFANPMHLVTTEIFVVDGNKEKNTFSQEMYVMTSYEELKKLLFYDYANVTDEMLIEELNKMTQHSGEVFTFIDSKTIKMEDFDGSTDEFYVYQNDEDYCPLCIKPSEIYEGKYTAAHTVRYESCKRILEIYRGYKPNFSWNNDLQRYVYDIAKVSEIDNALGNITEFSIGVANGKISDMKVKMSIIESGKEISAEDTIQFSYSNAKVVLPSDDLIIQCDHSYSSEYYETEINGKTYHYHMCVRCHDVIDFEEE